MLHAAPSILRSEGERERDVILSRTHAKREQRGYQPIKNGSLRYARANARGYAKDVKGNTYTVPRWNFRFSKKGETFGLNIL